MNVLQNYQKFGYGYECPTELSEVRRPYAGTVRTFFEYVHILIVVLQKISENRS